MKTIFSTFRISILVNGSPSREFSPRRGLRQEDPLSPSLFLIVGEILNRMLKEASLKDIFSGISIDNTGYKVFHLQFADDTILFLHNNYLSVQGIKHVLRCFELFSGLRINYSKS